MWPDVPPSTDGYYPQAIELHIFVATDDGQHVSHLYEDDGLTFKFRDGDYLRTDFTLTRTGTLLMLQSSVEGQGYTEFARQAFHLIFHGASPVAVRVNGQEILPEDGRFVVANTGTDFELDVDISS